MRFIVILVTFSLISCNNNEKRKPVGNSKFQKELNAFFKDASTSPLTKKDLKLFKGLPFFPIDNQYKVIANFTKLKSDEVFDFPTTTNRIVSYTKYGLLNFNLKNKNFSLTIYKENGLNSSELFLPFFDKTNKTLTYEGGRFLNILSSDIKDSIVEIDFNKAYNPYCTYNKKYSCPITPRNNFLDIEVKAGVKIKH